MTTLPEAIARWDKFLAGIDERFHDIMAEAQAGCAALLVERDHDTQAMTIAWGAMELRAKQLAGKIDDTWSDKLSPMFDEIGVDAAAERREQHKGIALARHLDVQLEATRVRVFADAARAVWQRAVAEIPSHVSCSQCGGPVAVPRALQAVNVDCPQCRAVVTVEPGMRTRMIEAFCVHPLCEEAAWSQWLAMRAAERAMHDARPTTLAVLRAYEAAQIEYWRTYLGKRGELLPARAPDFDRDLRGKLQAWYEQLEHDGVWRAAGCPRAL